MELVQYRCPGEDKRGYECNHRFFDARVVDGIIRIKCPKCGNFQVIGSGDTMFDYLQEKHEKHSGAVRA